MDAGAIEQALGLVAALTEPGGVLEDRLVRFAEAQMSVIRSPASIWRPPTVTAEP